MVDGRSYQEDEITGVPSLRGPFRGLSSIIKKERKKIFDSLITKLSTLFFLRVIYLSYFAIPMV